MAPVEMDLLRSLEQLQDAADAVFGRISSRVGLEHQRLMDLSRRIEAVRATVDSISGSRQAITVFSSAKYPQVSSPVDYRALFDEALPLIKVDLHTGSLQEDENEGTLELFRFFMDTNHERSNITLKHKDGMNADVRSIADILPVPFQEQKPPEQAPADASGRSPTLYPPPESLTQKNHALSPGLEEYGFKPTLRQVPLFSLPSKIPDLPMVADISWTGSRTEELSSIVPSASNTSSRRPTASKTQDLRSPQTTVSPPTVPQKVEETGPLKNDRGKNIIPPPPPPLPSASVIGSAINSSTPSKDKASTSLSNSSQDIPTIDPSRAALLASIRSPNIKLRKTETSERSPEPVREVEQQNSKQADLLAEMASTLKMRRLSMKGATQDNSGSPAAAASSSSRPPLPITNLKAFLPQTSGSDGDDDDWED